MENLTEQEVKRNAMNTEPKNMEKLEKDFLSFQDFMRLKSQLKDGQSLVITREGNSYDIKVGKVKDKATRDVGKLTPGFNSGNFDTFSKGMSGEKMRTTSVAYPNIIHGFKTSWESMINEPKNRTDFAVDMFLDKLDAILRSEVSTQNLVDTAVTKSDDTPSSKFRYHIQETSYAKHIEITIKGYPRKDREMTVGFSQWGIARYFIYSGVRSEL